MPINLDPKIIGAWLGVILPLWGGAAFLWNYEKNLVKVRDLDYRELDARIERTEIMIAIFSRDVDTLTEKEKNDYERAKARLINLEAQRDKQLGLVE